MGRHERRSSARYTSRRSGGDLLHPHGRPGRAIMSTPGSAAYMGEDWLAAGTGGCGLQRSSAETWAALPAQAALQACGLSCCRYNSARAGSSARSTWAAHQGW